MYLNSIFFRTCRKTIIVYIAECLIPVSDYRNLKNLENVHWEELVTDEAERLLLIRIIVVEL